MLNWENVLFHSARRHSVGQKVSKDGLKVDNTKVEAIEKFPSPSFVKEVCIFLGHAGSATTLIRIFSKK